jgi:hypothetical protein
MQTTKKGPVLRASGLVGLTLIGNRVIELLFVACATLSADA